MEENNPYPLYKAIKNKNLDEIRRIVNSDYDINTLDDEGEAAIHGAVRMGYVEGVRELLKNDTIIVAIRDTQYLFTPLMLACEYGYLEIVKLLLPRMTDEEINLTNKWGDTALIWSTKNTNVL